MSIRELKDKLMANKKFAKEYKKIDLAFEVSEQIFTARTNAGLSQNQLAKKLKTKQSSIARIENGENLPSLSFLEKIAEALGTKLLPPRFESATNNLETGSTEVSILSPYIKMSESSFKTDSNSEGALIKT